MPPSLPLANSPKAPFLGPSSPASQTLQPCLPDPPNEDPGYKYLPHFPIFLFQCKGLDTHHRLKVGPSGSVSGCQPHSLWPPYSCSREWALMEWHFSPEAHPLHIGSLKCTGSPPGLGDFSSFSDLFYLSFCPLAWVGALSCLQRGNQSSFNELEIYLGFE